MLVAANIIIIKLPQLAGKETATNAAIVDISATAQVGAFVCGRYMNTAGVKTAVATVCSKLIYNVLPCGLVSLYVKDFCKLP